MTLMERMKELGKSFEYGNAQCCYLCLSDKSLQEIKNNKDLLIHPETIKQYIKQNGDNLHIVQLLGNGGDIRELKSQLFLAKNPKSISWYNRSMTKFLYKGA